MIQISYDIIKAHGGEIKVNTKEGEGAEFIIKLPFVWTLDLLGFHQKQQPEGYEPAISISTKKNSDKIFISLKDNGNGIPQKVVGKIFQPFFTTKPTGQGTGLGLSLSYDIIKAHGGEITVESEEGGGSEFIIVLPTS